MQSVSKFIWFGERLCFKMAKSGETDWEMLQLKEGRAFNRACLDENLLSNYLQKNTISFKLLL